jgi:hypothetical protein
MKKHDLTLSLQTNHLAVSGIDFRPWIDHDFFTPRNCFIIIFSVIASISIQQHWLTLSHLSSFNCTKSCTVTWGIPWSSQNSVVVMLVRKQKTLPSHHCSTYKKQTHWCTNTTIKLINWLDYQNSTITTWAWLLCSRVITVHV